MATVSDPVLPQDVAALLVCLYRHLVLRQGDSSNDLDSSDRMVRATLEPDWPAPSTPGFFLYL